MSNSEIKLMQNDIETGLRSLGLLEGMYLEVHSSLSSFGYVEGGANTVIKSLMNIIGEDGVIIMPSFPITKALPLNEQDIKFGLKYKYRIFSEDSNEESGMGIIPDTFRKYPGVLTGKGIHRVSAWGKETKKNSEGLSNLIDNDGYALLIGVDIYRLTSMHYVEGKLPDDITKMFETPKELESYYPAHEWFIVTKEPPVKAWYTIQDEAYNQGLIKEKIIGTSKCMFFKVNDIIGIYEKAIEDNPYKLYGLENR